jgi:hypothetical protein
MAKHMIDLGLAAPSDSRQPITAHLTITDQETAKVLHVYELSEHDFVGLLRGRVIRAEDQMGDKS